MVSSLIPYYSGLLLGTNPASISTFDPLAAASAAAAAPAATPTPQQQELQSNQAKITGYGQIVSALNAFDASLQAVEQASTSGGDITTAAQQFVDAYNSLAASVSNLTGPSGSLSGDPVATGLMKELATTESAVVSGSLGSLSGIGISANPDGTLSLDTSALQSAYTSDPTDTAALLDQASQSLDSLANQYGDPGAILSSAMDATTRQDQVLQTEASAAQPQADAAQQQSVAESEALANEQLTAQFMSDLTQETFGLPPSTQSVTPVPLPGSGLSITA